MIESNISTERLLVCGDINLFLENCENNNTAKFLDILNTHGLKQHIKFPTQVSGHTLDFVISKSDIINEIQPIPGLYISDHCSILFSVSITKPKAPVKIIQTRSTKKIDLNKFKSDILTSGLKQQQHDPKQ